MRYRRYNILHILKNRKGMTLVELIVSFALLIGLMTATVATIMPAVRTFNHVISVSRSQSVSSLIADKISGELSTAKGDIKVKGNSIEYADQKGNVVVMSADADGKLLLEYKGAGTQWYFTEKVYMGCRLASDGGGLQFSKVSLPDGGGNNLVKVTLKVVYEKSNYEYKRSMIVDCFNSKTMVQ